LSSNELQLRAAMKCQLKKNESLKNSLPFSVLQFYRLQNITIASFLTGTFSLRLPTRQTKTHLQINY
jgi:hypothetical protein